MRNWQKQVNTFMLCDSSSDIDQLLLTRFNVSLFSLSAFESVEEYTTRRRACESLNYNHSNVFEYLTRTYNGKKRIFAWKYVLLRFVTCKQIRDGQLEKESLHYEKQSFVLHIYLDFLSMEFHFQLERCSNNGSLNLFVIS